MECAGSHFVGRYLWSRGPEFRLAHLAEWNALVPIWWANICVVGFLSSSYHIKSGCAGSNLVGKYLWSWVPEFRLAHKEWNALVPI